MTVKNASSGAPRDRLYEVLIVGGGPAGLSAALMLGRCRRRVLLCDDRLPRNRKSAAIHGLLTRDGMPPAQYLEIARRELRAYPSIETRRIQVLRLRTTRGGFVATLAGRTRVSAQRVLLATGVVDHFPGIPGFEAIYGRSAHHCPYCDAWEWRGQRIVVYGRGKAAVALSLKLRHWTADVVVCTDGPSLWSRREREDLKRAGIETLSKRITRLQSHGGRLQSVHFDDRTCVDRDALFFTLGQTPIRRIASSLGCQLTRRGVIRIFERGATSVSGVYAAGDLSTGHQFVATAVAQGVEAAIRMHESLADEERPRLRGRPRSERLRRRPVPLRTSEPKKAARVRRSSTRTARSASPRR